MVATTKEVLGDGSHYVQRLHALDIATGAEKFGGPIVIGDTIFAGGDPCSLGNYTYVVAPSVVGTADGGTNVSFNSLRANQRPGLLLSNGVVYVAWASYGDVCPYHGWVIGYDAQTLQQVAVFNTTPNGGLGGIWMSGAGLAADGNGAIYLSTGNGTFDVTGSQAPAYGDSVLKLATGIDLTVADFFTPSNQDALAANDQDLGSGGVLLLPDQPGARPHLMAAAGKEGSIYLIDRDDLGAYQRCGTTCDDVVQVTPLGSPSFGAPAYFNTRVYYQGVGDVLKAFELGDGFLSPVSQSTTQFGYPGSTPSVSANGSTNAIVWALEVNSSTAVLHAYDALDLSRELYASSQVPADQLDGGVKFAVPTVANGKVFVGTQSSLSVFGLSTQAKFTLTVHKTGTGDGTVTSTDGRIDCGTSCIASYRGGTTVTLTATPSQGSVFAGWSGCAGVSGATCTVTLGSGSKSVTATFNLQQGVALTVSKDGTGSGTVTSSDGGINCGPTCAATYDSVTTVTLAATPSQGSVFAGWSGCDGVSGPTCTVTMSGARSVTATFNVQRVTLTVIKAGTGSGTVTSSDGGISCGPTCAAPYDSGTLVTLTASASGGSTFGGWSGCDGVSGTTCTVMMSGARSVTATFTVQRFTLTVSKGGTGSGTVTSSDGGINCGPTCAAPYDSGTLVTLTASASGGSTFGGWSGCAGVSGTTCTVTMSGARSVTATFNVQRFTLTVSKVSLVSAGGTVTSSDGGINCGPTCVATYDSGTVVTLTATPDTLALFAGWSGDCSNLIGPCTVTMTSNRSVTATFGGVD